MSTNLDDSSSGGQLNLFDLPLVEKKKKVQTEAVVFAAPKIKDDSISLKDFTTVKQQKTIDKFKRESCISRVILYAQNCIGIEIIKDKEFTTHYIDKDGKEEFNFNRKSPVLPWDRVLYYSSDFITTEPSDVQLSELNSFLDSNKNNARRVIKRKGDENILIELADKVISITPIGWVLPFTNIKDVKCTSEELFQI